MDNQYLHIRKPQLRFPKFHDDCEWVPTSLGLIVDYENGVAHENDIDLEGDFIIVNSKFISSNGQVKKRTNTPRCLAQKDDVLMVLSDLPNGRALAKCFYVNENDLYTVNQRICKLHSKNVNSRLLYYLVNRNSYFLSFDDGVKQTNLKKDDVLQCPLLIPKLVDEQKNIANCLSALDEMLYVTNEKLKQLRTYKNGLVQKLFPAQGKTLPEYRFQEFDKDGEWKVYKVSDLFKITRGYVLPQSETKTVPDDNYKYPVYSSQTANNGLMGYYNKALYKDAITWTTDGANAGTVRLREGEFYCTNVCGVLISEKGCANLCVAEILGMISKRFVSLVGNPKLMNNVMAEIPICIPTLPEQSKIASCLSTIDEMINDYTEKVALFGQYKKGLMQQIFPTLK